MTSLFNHSHDQQLTTFGNTNHHDRIFSSTAGSTKFLDTKVSSSSPVDPRSNVANIYNTHDMINKLYASSVDSSKLLKLDKTAHILSDNSGHESTLKSAFLDKGISVSPQEKPHETTALQASTHTRPSFLSNIHILASWGDADGEIDNDNPGDDEGFSQFYGSTENVQVKGQYISDGHGGLLTYGVDHMVNGVEHVTATPIKASMFRADSRKVMERMTGDYTTAPPYQWFQQQIAAGYTFEQIEKHVEASPQGYAHELQMLQQKLASPTEEGSRLQVYVDTMGRPTVGIGHLVIASDNLKVGDTITSDRQAQFFNQDANKALSLARSQAEGANIVNPWFTAALADANFQLGNFVAKNPNTWNAIVNAQHELDQKQFDKATADFNAAADSLNSGPWMSETPVRVHNLQDAIRAIPNQIQLYRAE